MGGINETLKKRNWTTKVKQAVGSQQGQQSQNYIDYPRMPTNIFPLDYALAGGLPVNVVTQLFGPFQGGKSTLSYLAAKALDDVCMRCLQPIALCKCGEPTYVDHCAECRKPVDQCTCKNFKNKIYEACLVCGKDRISCSCRNQLRQKAFICQFEGVPPDNLYFMTLGYDAEKNLYSAQPDHGEEGCEMIEAAAKADDVGLIIVDSLANMVPRAELEANYEDALVANQARLIARLFRRLSNVLVKEYKRGHLVSVLFLNQMRTIIGAGKWEPSETTPGGWASKHGYRLSVRVSQLKGNEDGDMSKDSMTKNVLRFSASMLGPQSKQQMLILAGKCEYRITISEQDGYSTGKILDHMAAVSVARKMGILEKAGNEYVLDGSDMKFNKLVDIEEMFKTGVYKDRPGMDNAFRYMVVRMAKERAIRKIMDQFNRRVQVIQNPND